MTMREAYERIYTALRELQRKYYRIPENDEWSLVIHPGTWIELANDSETTWAAGALDYAAQTFFGIPVVVSTEAKPDDLLLRIEVRA